jgi:endoglucanase
MITSLFRRTFQAAILALACLATPTLAHAQSVPWFNGINIAGAEFGGKKLPGIHGSDYIYPNSKDIDYFLNKGFNTIRLPFKWERLQRKLNGPFEPEEFLRIDLVVSHAAAKKAYVLLDPHNYARYYGNVIGSSAVPISAFASFWRELASRYKNNPYVIFGLMNEPYNMAAADWRRAVEAAISAIRGTGAKNLILVPGVRWTGAHSWLSGGSGSNGAVFASLKDPANNMMFEVHQYFDSDYSGTSSTCQNENIGVTTLQNFTAWARENNHRAMVGELGAANNSTCLTALDRMLSYMEKNSDVWNGWTYWAAGAWWGNYMFSVQPTSSGGDKPQMAVLEKHVDFTLGSGSGPVASSDSSSDSTSSGSTSSGSTSSGSTSSGSTSSGSTSSGSTSSGSTSSGSTSSGSTSSGSTSSGSSTTQPSASDPSRNDHWFAGINIAGAEFGKKIPGTHGRDYIYPNANDIDYFLSKGFNTIRLPFKWERLQPKLGGPLEPEELMRIDRVVAHAAAKKAYVILDPHNFARYKGEVIGSSSVRGRKFRDFWKALAAHYKNHPYVIFGLMNEPHTISAYNWRRAVDAAIGGIRGQGAKNLILVPGTYRSGAHNWLSSDGGMSNAEALQSVKDPANNLLIEVHQYLDSDFSGRSGSCQSESVGVTALQQFTDWARRNNHRAFLSEFAGGANETCMKAMEQMLTYMENNADVWTGWAYWAAGAWWGNYRFSVQPTASGGDKPQMSVLKKHLNVKIELVPDQVADESP